MPSLVFVWPHAAGGIRDHVGADDWGWDEILWGEGYLFAGQSVICCGTMPLLQNMVNKLF